MGTIWNEERVRAEFARLDRLTGLSGASLPISFGNACSTLGCYYGGKNKRFRFSNHWLDNPDWPEEAALDLIRHEYAHYMDEMLGGDGGHGTSWKACCMRIGAAPVRLYQEEITRCFVRQHEAEAQLAEKLCRYTAGTAIKHRVFGRGVIKNVEGSGSTAIALVDFARAGEKRLALSWIDENCKPA